MNISWGHEMNDGRCSNILHLNNGDEERCVLDWDHVGLCIFYHPCPICESVTECSDDGYCGMFQAEYDEE